MNTKLTAREHFLCFAHNNTPINGKLGSFSGCRAKKKVDFLLEFRGRLLHGCGLGKLLLVLCFGFWTIYSSAFATDYHVSLASGLDVNPGTLAQPWRTIQKAANTVAPGDTVNIHSGIYTECVILSGKRATAAQPILFRTLPGDTTAVVDQSGVTPPNGSSALLKIENCDHVTVQDIEFRNYKTTSTSKVPIGIAQPEFGGISERRC